MILTNRLHKPQKHYSQEISWLTEECKCKCRRKSWRNPALGGIITPVPQKSSKSDRQYLGRCILWAAHLILENHRLEAHAEHWRRQRRRASIRNRLLEASASVTKRSTYHGEDQECPCGSERRQVVRLIEPYHQHRKTNKKAEANIDPIIPPAHVRRPFLPRTASSTQDVPKQNINECRRYTS